MGWWKKLKSIHMASKENISVPGSDEDLVQRDTVTTSSSIKADTFVPNTELGSEQHKVNYAVEDEGSSAEKMPISEGIQSQNTSAGQSVNYIVADVPDALTEEFSVSDGIRCSFPTHDEAKLPAVKDSACEDVEDVKDDSHSKHSESSISQDITYPSVTISISGETRCTSHVDDETKDSVLNSSSHKDLEVVKGDRHLPVDTVEENYEKEVMPLCPYNDAHVPDHSTVEVADDDNESAKSGNRGGDSVSAQFDAGKQEEAIAGIRDDVGAVQKSNSSSHVGQLNSEVDIDEASKSLLEDTTITISSGEDFHSESRLEIAIASNVSAKDAHSAMDERNGMCDVELSVDIEGTKGRKLCGMVGNRAENVIVSENNLEKGTVKTNAEHDNESRPVNVMKTSQCPKPSTDGLPVEDILAGTSNEATIEVHAKMSQEEHKRTTFQSDDNEIKKENLLIPCSKSNKSAESEKLKVASPAVETVLEKQDKASNSCDISLPQPDEALFPQTDVTSVVPALQENDKLAEVGNNVPMNKNSNAAGILSKEHDNNEEIGRGNNIYDETEGEMLANDLEESNSVSSKGEPCNETEAFEIGDLVWAKVKSHPWWPAQIFNPTDASKSAMKMQKDGRFLLAFFGDGTFAWLQGSEMIPFKPSFEEMAKQTTIKRFRKAVDEALEEVCRRSAVGLTSKYHAGTPYRKITLPDANSAIQKAAAIENHPDISSNVHMFEPVKALGYLRSIACSPFSMCDLSLESAELLGHVFALRNFMVPSENCLEYEKMYGSSSARKASGSNRKRRFSSLESAADDESVETRTDRQDANVSYQTPKLLENASPQHDNEEIPSHTGFESEQCKPELTMTESSEERNGENAVEMKRNGGMRKLRGAKMQGRIERKKLSKFGDSMKKVAGELTGSLPLAKCVEEPSSKRVKSSSKEAPSSEGGISLAQLCEGLHVSARDPLNSSGMNLLQDRVKEGILRFRTKVFKDSTGDLLRKTKKALTRSPKQANGVSPKRRAGYRRVSRQNDKKTSAKDPTTAAAAKRKRKSRDGAKKKAKAAADAGEERGFESFIDSEEPRRFDKDTIKYSRRPAASPSSPESKEGLGYQLAGFDFSQED